MNDMIDETRTIVIGGKSEVYHGFYRLRDRADGLIDAIARIEREMPPDSPGMARAWKDIGELADVLTDVLDAQDSWLADHDAALLRDIETFRSTIRAMREAGDTTRTESDQ